MLHHLALRTHQPGALCAHYQDACGLHASEQRPNGSVWLRAGEVVLMLELRGEQEPAPDPRSLELLAFCLDEGESLEAAERRLRLLGVAVEARTEHTLYFRDPDGRRNALSRYRFESPG